MQENTEQKDNLHIKPLDRTYPDHSAVSTKDDRLLSKPHFSLASCEKSNLFMKRKNNLISNLKMQKMQENTEQKDYLHIKPLDRTCPDHAVSAKDDRLLAESASIHMTAARGQSRKWRLAETALNTTMEQPSKSHSFSPVPKSPGGGNIVNVPRKITLSLKPNFKVASVQLSVYKNTVDVITALPPKTSAIRHNINLRHYDSFNYDDDIAMQAEVLQRENIVETAPKTEPKKKKLAGSLFSMASLRHLLNRIIAPSTKSSKNCLNLNPTVIGMEFSSENSEARLRKRKVCFS